MAQQSSSAVDRRTQFASIEFHIVPYSHTDYAFTHHRQWHAERYVLIVNEVLDVMKQMPEFTWMLDNIDHVLVPFLYHCPARLGELKERVLEGRIEITNGVVALLRPTQVGDETFIRNISLGKSKLQSLFPGLDPKVYHSVDVSIGHSQMPQLLKLGGYRYYRAWRPQGAMDHRGIPRQFRWKGADGTTVLCSRGTYAGLCGLGYLERDFSENWSEMVQQFYDKELADLAELSKAPVAWVPYGMDDTRPLLDYDDRPVRIREFISRLRTREGFDIRWSTAADYFARLDQFELGEVDGVLDGCDVGYNAPTKGDKGLWRLRILLDNLIVKAEMLWTFASLLGEAYPADEIAALWEALLGISGHALEFVLAQDYAELYDMASSAHYRVAKLIADAKHRLATKISGDGEKRIVVYNTLNWEREEILPLRIAFPTGGREFDVFAADGAPLDYQICRTSQGDVRYQGSSFDEVDVLVRAKLPPMGYTTLLVKERPKDHEAEDFGVAFTDIDFLLDGAGTQQVDTGVCKVAFRNGRIVGLSDETGRIELANAGSDLELGKLKFTTVRHHARAAWLFSNHYVGMHDFTPERWHWTEYGPLRWRYVVWGKIGPHRAKQEIVLYRDKRHIDFSVDIECLTRQTGFFSVEFPVDQNPGLLADIPFGVEKRQIACEPYGKATDKAIDNIERIWKGLFYARNWVRFHSLGGNFLLIGEGTGRYFLYDDCVNTVSVILTRTYDLNQSQDWLSEAHPFLECIGVSNFRYTLCLLPPGSEREVVSAVRLAREKALKPEVETLLGYEQGGCHRLPAEKTWFGVKCDSAVVSAFHKHDDGYMLRLYESQGQEVELVLSSFRQITKVLSVDFCGRPHARAPVDLGADGYSLRTTLRSNEIVNLLVHFR